MKNSILIVYQNIQHYRIPVFKLLCEQEYNDYRILADTKSKTDILSVDLSHLSKEKLKNKITFTEIKNYYFKSLLWQKGLISQVIKKENQSIIFLGDPHFISTWFAVVIANLLGKNTYFWTHAFIRGNSLSDKIKKLFFSLPNKGLLLYGEKAKHDLISKGFDSSKLNVIYNSLDYDYQLKIRNNLTNDRIMKKKAELFNNDYPTIFFIGRLTPQKKLDKLITLINKLHYKNIPCNLLFIGDGADKEDLISQVENVNLNRYISFYGKCHSEDELGPIIASCDICISPGEIGLTAMHSLVYGTPVITHNSYIHQMPEYEAIQPGYNGDFFKYNDDSSLLTIVTNWLNKQNKEREKIRQNCYEIIDKKYNPHNQVKILNKLLCFKK